MSLHNDVHSLHASLVKMIFWNKLLIGELSFQLNLGIQGEICRFQSLGWALLTRKGSNVVMQEQLII